MRAVFIHDHNFFIDPLKNIVYDTSGGAFDQNLWERYLKTFDSLTVVGRETNKEPNRLVVSSGANVDFKLINNLNHPWDRFLKKNEIFNRLNDIIQEVEFVIIRLPSVLGYIASEVCAKINKPYILEVVGDPFDAYWYYGSLLGKVIAPFEALKMKVAVKRSKGTIYVTKEYLQQKYPSPNVQAAISNVRLEEIVSEKTAIKFYKNNTDSFNIGLIGSFHVRYKGHLEALKAIRDLKGSKMQIKLFLVGTGDPSWLESRIKDYQIEHLVEIVGTLESGKDQIFPFMDTLHLLINPSKTEGLPRVVIEAMSRGKICLASNAGGTSELLDDFFLHKVEDWKELSLKIKEIYNFSISDKQINSAKNLKTARNYLEVELQKKRNDMFNILMKS